MDSILAGIWKILRHRLGRVKPNYMETILMGTCKILRHR